MYAIRSYYGYAFGKGSLNHLGELIDKQKNETNDWSVFMIDKFFEDKKDILKRIPTTNKDLVIFIDPINEPVITSYSIHYTKLYEPLLA